MSTENINNTNKENQMILNTSKVFAKNLTSRVDINVLMNRVRLVKEKENRINLIFLGLILVLVAIVGIILSF